MLRRRDQKPTQHSGNPDWCCAGPVPRDSPTVGRPPLPCTHASAAGVVTKGARASLCTSPGPLQHRETNRDGDHRLALRPRLVIAPLTCEHSSHQTGGRRPIPVPSAKVTRSHLQARFAILQRPSRLLGPSHPSASGHSVPPSVIISCMKKPSRKIMNKKIFVDDEVHTVELNLRRDVRVRALAPGLAGGGLSPTPIAGLRRKRASRVDARGFLLKRKWL